MSAPFTPEHNLRISPDEMILAALRKIAAQLEEIETRIKALEGARSFVVGTGGELILPVDSQSQPTSSQGAERHAS